MKIVRPPADVARYTMVFHKRDSGNEINKDRSVNVEVAIICYTCLYTTWLNQMHLYCADSFRSLVLFPFQDEVVGTNTTGMEKGRTQQLLI